MTGRHGLKADLMPTSIRPRAAACATRARSPVESHESHPCSRPGAAAKTGWSEGLKEVPFESQGCMHGSRGQGQVTSRTKAGSRLLLEPQLRWFRMGPTKAAHAPEGILAVLQGGRPPQTKSQPQSPSPTAPEPLRPLSTQSGARETRKRETTDDETPKTRRLRRASALWPTRDAAAAPPHRCGAGRTQRTKAHKKLRGQSRRRDE